MVGHVLSVDVCARAGKKRRLLDRRKVRKRKRSTNHRHRPYEHKKKKRTRPDVLDRTIMNPKEDRY